MDHIHKDIDKGSVRLCEPTIQNLDKYIPVVMFRLCMGTHFATCDHDAVHKICARSATRYTLLILLPRPGTHFNKSYYLITRDNITYNICCHVC